MGDFKPFDPDEIDETLTRVVTHGRTTYLLFPYIQGTGAVPKFNSISRVIAGAAATAQDFSALSALVKQAGSSAVWLISFNTPWLMPVAELENVEQRPPHGKPNRR